MRRTLVPFLVVLALSTSVCVGVALQESPRVVGLAVATVEPGHMAEYMSIVEESVMPFLAEQGVEVIGVFQNFVGGPSNELYIMAAYRDLAHIQAVSQNSTLTDIQQQTFEGMRVLSQKTLLPVPFSPFH
jgi:hypothetical protein